MPPNPVPKQSSSQDQIYAQRAHHITLDDKSITFRNNSVHTSHGFPHRARASIRYSHLVSYPVMKHTLPMLLLYLDAPLIKSELPSVPRLVDSGHKHPTLLSVLDPHDWDSLSMMVQDASELVVQSEDLEALQSAVATLMDNAAQFIHSLLDPHFSSDVYTELEGYLMEQVYDVVFFKITQLVLPRDQHLSQVMDLIKDVDLSQLGLPEPSGFNNESRRRAKRAVHILQKIATFRSPGEKLGCLLSTIHELSSTSPPTPTSAVIHLLPSPLANPSTPPSSTDELVPLLLFTLIQSNVPHWTAHWTYMKEFATHIDVVHGPAGFALSTLEAVLAYIDQTAQDELSHLSSQNCQSLPETDPWLRDRQGNTQLMLACARKTAGGDQADEETSLARAQALWQLYRRHPPTLNEDDVDNGDDDEATNDLITMVNDQGDTLLMVAIRSGASKIVTWLLSHPAMTSPAYLSRRNDHGQTAAHLAIHHLPLLQVLDQYGASLALADAQGNTPLHLSCQAQDQPTMAFLLQRLPLSARRETNRLHQTFYHLCKNDALLEQYADHDQPGVRVGADDVLGRSPWLTWAYHGQFRAMATLLDHPMTDPFELVFAHHNVSDDQRCYGVTTALHDMSRHWPLLIKYPSAQRTQLIHTLVQRLQDLVNIPDQDGQRPLHLSVLVARSCSLHKQGVAQDDEEKDTMLAVYEQWLWALFVAGADPFAVNRTGQQPLDLCGDTPWQGALVRWLLQRRHYVQQQRHKKKKKKHSRFARPSPRPNDGASLASKPSPSMAWVLTHAPLAYTKTLQFAITSGLVAADNDDTPPCCLDLETVHRGWDDFVALRQQLLHEHPELFLPTLTSLLDPLMFHIYPPPMVLVNQSMRQFHRFLDYLQRHPVLRCHDAVLRFVRSSTFDMAVLETQSFSKRNLMLDTLERMTPPPPSEFDEGSFLSYAQGLMMPMMEAFTFCLQQAVALVAGQQGCADAWEQLAHEIGPLTVLSGHQRRVVKVCASLSCDTITASPLSALVEALTMMQDITGGILKALQYPWTLLDQQSKLTLQLERQREAVQKGQHPPWNGFFTGQEQSKQLDRDKQLVNETLKELQRVTNQIHQSHQMITDELALYQQRHTDEMIQAARQYARQQLKLEKLKLRWLIQASGQ
ncbi:hypothetical protein DM01DRAFT_1383500 [Hesseltinella vesiculosa]|uniref:VPS9 domain-containing protein n=1 Tax=Hesseltinella vesiculosa TaxID=101127 RepID=A0A1X2GHV3_9FUNG|nr:hypothetical protein DM01DRAFT_1383500 [Hesseltinella vesiculosa]